jgi:hypothetical protein
MFAQNIAHQAVIDGYTVLFTSVGQLLIDLRYVPKDAITSLPQAPPGQWPAGPVAGRRRG